MEYSNQLFEEINSLKGVTPVEDDVAVDDTADTTDSTDSTDNEEVEDSSTGTEEPTVESSKEETENFFTTFAKEVGIDEITGESGQDLIDAVNNHISKIKSEYEIYENPEIKKIAEILSLGGTVEDYINLPKTTNYYQDLVIEDDSTELAENIVKHALKSSSLYDDEDIQQLIKFKKENGQFIEYSRNILNTLKTQEKSENDKIIKDSEDQIALVQKQQKEFFDTVDKTFKDGLTGITVDKSILERARDFSLPLDNKQPKIYEILQDLTPQEQVLINTFVLALKDNKPFSFNSTASTKKYNSIKEKPIDFILRTNNKSDISSDKGSLEDLESILKQKIK